MRLSSPQKNKIKTQPSSMKQTFYPSILTCVCLMLFACNANAMVTTGLVAWWPFEEASGALNDTTGHVNGTYNGTLYQQQGKIDFALGFDAVNDYANIDGIVPFISAAAGTLECWVKANTTTGTPYILCGDTNTRTYVSLTSGKFTLTKGSTAVSLNLGWADTNWNHLVMTWNNGLLTGYRNGVSYGSVSFAGTNAGTQMKIGSWRTGVGQYFNGLIDEVRIYNRALTAAEVSENFRLMAVKAADCAIVLPNATGAQLDAANLSATELQHHIALITGGTVGIYTNDSTVMNKYRFYMGNRSAFNVPQKAQWIVESDKTTFTGDANSYDFGSKIATHAFLEEQLGIRWIEPGEGGIMYKPGPSLHFTTGTYTWQPVMELRKLRADAKANSYAPLTESDLTYPFREFQRSEQEYYDYAADVSTWQERQRLGNYTGIEYGHAFTQWWGWYGANGTRSHHLEYFALNAHGVREPEISTRVGEVKRCVTNTAARTQIITNWNSATTKYVNVCENDGWYGFCRCSFCQEKDQPTQGATFSDEHMTDRYVWFTNQVARAAKAIRPDACAVMYAYCATLQPPLVEKLDDNVIVVVVPTTLDPTELAALFSGWKAAWADPTKATLGLRPNFLCEYDDIVIPTGSEKQLYTAFMTAYTQAGGIVLADYDSITGVWKPNGLAFYVLAKAMSDPSQTYDYWLDHYCSAFGNAAQDVKAYYEYWRSFWENTLWPNYETIRDSGGDARQFTRGLTFTLGTYYAAGQFDTTDALLQTGAAKTLTDSQRAKLDQMILANQHGKKTYLAEINPGNQSYALDLINFRLDNKVNLMEENWIQIFWSEMNYGDHGSQDAALWTQDWLDSDAYTNTYSNSIVTSGLVSWWKCEEITGNIMDAVTTSHNDGLNNGALYRQTGYVNYGLGFDGGDYVDCGNASSLQLVSNFTVEAWVKCSQFGSNLGVVTKQISGAHGGWSMLRLNNNKFKLLISDTTGLDYVDSMFPVTDSGWHHLAMVVSPIDNGVTTTDFYVDGILQLDQSTHNISESGMNFMIGRTYSNYASRYFNGMIDEVRVYNRALTPGEVIQNFRCTY